MTNIFQRGRSTTHQLWFVLDRVCRFPGAWEWVKKSDPTPDWVALGIKPSGNVYKIGRVVIPKQSDWNCVKMWIWLNMYGKTYRFPLYHQLPYIRIALFWPCASHFQTHQDQGCESFPAACRRQKWGLSQQIDSHKGVTYLQLWGSCNSHLFYIIYICVLYYIG